MDITLELVRRILRCALGFESSAPGIWTSGPTHDPAPPLSAWSIASLRSPVDPIVRWLPGPGSQPLSRQASA